MSADANGPGAEALELLSRLVAFDTVNPPGNERAAQEYLADHLSKAGFDCELLGAEPVVIGRRCAERARRRTAGR